MSEEPLRINLVMAHQVPFPPTRGGGVHNLVWMIAKQFASRGHRVVAYSPTAEGLASQEIDSLGIEHLRVAGAPGHANVWVDNLNALPYALRIWPLLKPADITSFHTPFSFLLRYKRGLGVCTHTLHRTPKRILRFYAKLDRIYGGSHAVIEQALAIAPHLAPKLKAVHNCIELPDEPPLTTSSEPFTFLYVGRFVRDKGLESLIRGFLAIVSDDPAVRLRIIGPQTSEEGTDVSFLEQMRGDIAGHPGGTQISLEPSIYDRAVLFEQINQAAVFCLPSLTGETFSMAALEAMSCAKPLLVSDFGPMREMVDHQGNGYIAKAGDNAGWAEGIRWFLQRRDAIAAMGLRSFEKARNEFSAGRIADEYIADFRALLSARHRRETRSATSEFI